MNHLLVTGRGMPRPLRSPQAGISLVVVLMILVVVSLLGVGGAQMALLGERASRYDRDYQVAWQAGESALTDGQDDIEGKSYAGAVLASPLVRGGLFGQDAREEESFTANCGIDGNPLFNGLCAASDPATWQTIDFTADNAAATSYSNLGDHTSRQFMSGDTGLQPSKTPRYMIERLPNFHAIAESAKEGDYKEATYYRITTSGYGPRVETKVLLQAIYRRAAN